MNTEQFQSLVLQKLEFIESKLGEHDKRFDAQDKRFDAHDKRFDEQCKRFDALEKGQKELIERVGIIQNKTAHLVEFETETKDALNTISKSIDELKGQVNIVEKVTKENTYEIAKLKAAQ